MKKIKNGKIIDGVKNINSKGFRKCMIALLVIIVMITGLIPAGVISALEVQAAEDDGYYWGETVYRGEGTGVVTIYREDSSAAMGRVELNPGDRVSGNDVILIQAQPGPCSTLKADWPAVFTADEEWGPGIGYMVGTDASDPLQHYDGAWYRFVNTNCPGNHQAVNKMVVVEFDSTGEGHSLSTEVTGSGSISLNMAVPGGSNIKRAKAGDAVSARVEPDSGYTLTGLYLLAADDSVPTSLYHQITSDFTQNSFNPKLYDFTMPDYDAKVAAVFQNTMTPVPVARTVTYQVQNGTWSDGTTQNKTETVNSGSYPANVPTGMIAKAGYEGGAWDADPASLPITDDKTFTYTFIEEAVAATHTLTVSADPTEGGTVTGGGKYTVGEQVAAKATANEGYVFDGWYKGSERVGGFDWYILNLNEDTNLVAKFHKFTSAEVEVDIDAPLCGVETETTGSLPAGGYDGSTQTNRPKGTVKTAGWGEGSFGWDAFFYGWNNAPSAFQGNFKAGETYLVRGSIAPENGTMPDEVKIVVNGTELSSDRVQVINETSYKAVQFIAQVEAVHDIDFHDETAADCEQPGTKAYYQCNGCSRLYSEATGSHEISREDLTIPASGHDWSMQFNWGMPAVPFGGTVTYAKPDVYLVCSRALTHKQSVPADKVTFEENRTDPKCEEDGSVVYSASADYLGAHGSDSKTVTLNKLGHDWGAWTVTKEATTEEAGQRVHSCMREGCGKSETQTIPKVQTFTISFDAGDGSGEMASVQVANNEDWHLPQGTFTHPDGKAFKAWSAGGSEYQAGQKYTPTADITFTALWSEAKYTGPSGIHYVEVGDSKTFTYKANEGWFYQLYDTQGLSPKASKFLSISGIKGDSNNESDRRATEFTVTFAPTYFPEGSETIGKGGYTYTVTHCETMITPNIFWRNTGVGDFDYLLMDKFVVVPGRTSIEVNKTKLVLHPGDTFTLVPTTSPEGLDVTFTPGNNGVVSVDENGVVTALRLGKDTVTVSTGGDGNYLRSEAIVEIIVVERADLLLDPVAPVEPDGNVTINGRLLDKDGKGIGGQTIKISAKPFGQGEDLTNEYLFSDVQTAADGSFSAVGSWKVPDQFKLADFDVTVSLDSEDFGCEPAVARVSVINPTLSVTGSIVWDDSDNIDGRRPERTWLKIRRTDGAPVLDKDGNSVADLVEIAGTKGTKISATWEDLPTHADIGGGRTQRVSYEVVETDQDGAVWTPGGYEKLASGDMENGFVITNRHVPLQTDIVVNKVWEDDDNAAGKRPESVTLHVDQARPSSTSTDDDIKDVAAALTADEAGGWKAAWSGLPYRQKVSGFSTEILYSVREDAVKNYAGRLVQTDAGLRASIVWADGVNEEDKPASITATLINENGDATSRTAVLNEANNWTCEFTGIPEHMAAGNTVSLFPGLQSELGCLQYAVVWEYTLTNTLIPTIELTIDAPRCGTVVDEDKSYPVNPADGSRGPEAQSNRPVGTILTSGWEFVESTVDPSVDWLKWGPFTNWNENPTMVFPITLTGGSSYNALGRIVPAGGATVPAAVSLVINGQELPQDRVKVDNDIIYFAASIEAEHTLEKQARVAPSCSKTGTEEHWKCTGCGKLYADENGQNEIAEPVAIEKLAHTPGAAVHENEVPASCSAEGSYDEVVYCTECKAELSRETKKTDKLAHDWNEPEYKWADDNSTVTATRVCKHNSTHTETETADATGTETKPAACTEKGETTYTANFKNTAFTEQTKTEKDIPAKGHNPAAAVRENEVPAACETDGSHDEVVYCTECKAEISRNKITDKATGHDWGAPEYKWADDNSTVTATRVCSHNSTHTETETANVTSEETKPASCTEKGETTYTAKFSNTAFAEQTKTLKDVPVKPHTPAAAVRENEVPATCEADGTHDEVVYCSECKAEISRKAVTEKAIGHIWGEWKETTPATCEGEGEETRVCTHDASHKQTRKTDALGHDWASPVYTWADDNSTVTATRSCRHNPAHTETETVKTTSEITKETTVFQKGERAYTAVFKNTAFAEQKKTVDIPELKDDSNPDDGNRQDEQKPKPDDNKNQDQKQTKVTKTFAPLMLRSTKQTGKSIKLEWKEIDGAAKYIIYGSPCGKDSKVKKLATVKGMALNTAASAPAKKAASLSKTIKKIGGNKVTKGRYYKFYVAALDSSGKKICVSRVIHVAAAGGKYGNYKSVTTRAKNNKVTLKAGKKFNLRAKGIPDTIMINSGSFSKNGESGKIVLSRDIRSMVKEHVGLRYESSNTKIASVSRDGVIKAKKKGICNIYVYTQSGTMKKIRVTVK